MNRLSLSASLLALLLVAGCSSDTTDPGTTNNGPLSMKLNGSAWAPTTLNALWTNNVLGLGGSEFGSGATKQLNISGPVTAAGTYQLTLTSPVRALWSETAMTGGSVNSKIFTATSGTLVVQEISTSGAKGTFSFEGNTDVTGGPGETRSITEGTFNVTF